MFLAMSDATSRSFAALASVSLRLTTKFENMSSFLPVRLCLLPRSAMSVSALAFWASVRLTFMRAAAFSAPAAFISTVMGVVVTLPLMSTVAVHSNLNGRASGLVYLMVMSPVSSFLVIV